MPRSTSKRPILLFIPVAGMGELTISERQRAMAKCKHYTAGA